MLVTIAAEVETVLKDDNVGADVSKVDVAVGEGETSDCDVGV